MVKIDAEIPGGNILVERQEEDEVWVCQDLRDTEGDWFYWYFRVRGIAGRTLRVHFTRERTIGVRGPAISRDGGWSWEWLGADQVEANSFLLHGGNDDELHVAMAMPYTQRHFDAFMEQWHDEERLQLCRLCQSRQERDVELLHLDPPERMQPQVMITCRHHACESMASYALEGFITAALTDVPIPAEFFIVPFVDKDGVENGDQGKNRRPHDHNRDYQRGLYPEVTAIRHLADKTRRLRVMLDLHCPWLLGEGNEEIYLVGSPEAPIQHEQEQFGSLLAVANQGPLPFRAADFMPFGTGWNTSAATTAGICSTRWFARLPHTRLVTTIELPYANVRGVENTIAHSRAFGRDLAHALLAYMRSQQHRTRW